MKATGIVRKVDELEKKGYLILKKLNLIHI